MVSLRTVFRVVALLCLLCGMISALRWDALPLAIPSVVLCIALIATRMRPWNAFLVAAIIGSAFSIAIHVLIEFSAMGHVVRGEIAVAGVGGAILGGIVGIGIWGCRNANWIAASALFMVIAYFLLLLGSI